MSFTPTEPVSPSAPAPSPTYPGPPVGPRVGVIAFQGDFERHLSVLKTLGAEARPVRRPEELDSLQALIIPGGESTTIGMLMERFGLLSPVRERVIAGFPVMGTCAGAILLAREIEGSDQVRIGTLDITIRRNAYGRQVDSFDAPLTVVSPSFAQVSPAQDDPPVGVFIRAPRIIDLGSSVETIALVDDDPVVVRSGGMLALTFHPELTGDHRLHRYFLSMIRR